MKGFLLGLVVAGLAFGGYMYWKQRQDAESAAHVAPDGAPRPRRRRSKKKKRRRGAQRLAQLSEPAAGEGAPERSRREAPQGPLPTIDPEPEPIKLGASDLKPVSQGDDLSRPDVIHLGDATDDSGSHELTQDEIDLRFRAKEEAILGCIARARPDEDTYVPGRVTVKFRIQRTGNVRGVRVEAPSILQKGGSTGA